MNSLSMKCKVRTWKKFNEDTLKSFCIHEVEKLYSDNSEISCPRSGKCLIEEF